MALDTAGILTIDATIITGILILLTVSSFAQAQNGDTTIDDFRKILTMVIILPFSASAFSTLQGKFKQIIQPRNREHEIHNRFQMKARDLAEKFHVSPEVEEYSWLAPLMMDRKLTKEENDYNNEMRLLPAEETPTTQP